MVNFISGEDNNYGLEYYVTYQGFLININNVILILKLLKHQIFLSRV